MSSLQLIVESKLLLFFQGVEENHIGNFKTAPCLCLEVIEDISNMELAFRVQGAEASRNMWRFLSPLILLDDPVLAQSCQIIATAILLFTSKWLCP